MTIPYNKGKGRGIRWIREHVNFVGEECLTWPMHRDDKGHGIVGLNGRRHKAARVICEMAHGKPPSPEYETAHSCGLGHEGCCNPRHGNEGEYWNVMSEAADEIERLRALVKLAADAYETGGEDECCVACMDIAKAVADEQSTRGEG